MYSENMLWIAQAENEEKSRVCIIPSMANRHGLISGATGTGKTVTLKILAESFSEAGVPVFMADIKGDVSGLAVPGTDSEGMQKRIDKFGIRDGFTYHGYPTSFWDIFGKKGTPLRTTVSEMGPMLLSMLLELNDTQSDILSIVFKIADDKKLLLLDMKDLRSMITYVTEDLEELTKTYGSMTKQSLGTISRKLLALENEGADFFFGEPALDIRDWIHTDTDGLGYINIMDSTELINYPKLYSCFMLWLLSDLYEIMPECGDCDKPKMIFFFDEAHLLFDGISKGILQKIEQIVKLIRSKGIGIYFCSQSPSDIPDEILSQLGNRIQHALRAYTPADQKTVKAAAQAFRVNPDFKTEEVITELGTGEALVSFLDEKGAPAVVQKAYILCPHSLMDAIQEADRENIKKADMLFSKYGQDIDRESAYEILQQRFAEEEEKEKAEEEAEAKAKEEKEAAKAKREAEKEAARKEAAERKAKSGGRRGKSSLEKGMDTAMQTLGREATRSLFRGLLKNLLK